MKRAFFHFACAVLLLSAQLSALTHSVWHLHDYLPAHALADHAGAAHDDDDGGNTPSSQAELCIFHAALGSLFAGGCAGKPALGPAADSSWLANSLAVRRVARTVTLPPSRAPPVLL